LKRVTWKGKIQGFIKEEYFECAIGIGHRAELSLCGEYIGRSQAELLQ